MTGSRHFATSGIRWTWPLLLAGSQLFALGTVRAAGVLVENFHEALIEYAGPGVPLTSESDPWFVSETFAGAYRAEADYLGPNGVLRGFAKSTDTFGVQSVSRSGVQATFRNGGNAAINFAAGSIVGDAHVTFSRQLGTDDFGLAAHTMVVTTFGSGPGFTGAAQIAYTYTASNGSAAAPPDVIKDESGGFEIVALNYDTQALQVAMHFPAFVLQPGDVMRIGFAASASALGFAMPGSPGWSATTDYGQTGFLRMSLPTGVDIVTERPVPWITVVPDAPAGVLMSLGLAVLAARRARFPVRRVSGPC